MPILKKDYVKIQEHVHKAYTKSRLLNDFSVTIGGGRQVLEALADALETAVLETRRLVEMNRPRTVPPESPRAPDWQVTQIAGSIEVNSCGWLHITLNTLLPHCRFKSSPYLSDTISRLLAEFRAQGGRVPFFHKAMLVIDEHCDIQNRQVFDSDNKSWKAIPNALKGVVIEDDDQRNLEIALLSTEDSRAACHIYVLDAEEAGEFFSIRSGQYGLYL